MSRRSSNTAVSAKEAPKAAATTTGAARARKPAKRYVEESSWETVKNLSRRAANKQERKKEKFVEGQGQTKDKWYRYKSKISQLVRAIVKDQHTVDTYENDQKATKAAKDEVSKCNARIESNKRAILRLFEELDAENSEHKRWEKLASGYDDDNSVDVEDIMCSRCSKPDEEGNDIVFCDRAGCLRAYHQKCLDPPFRPEESHPESAWFCRQCACMDDCLDMVGELLDADCNHYSQLFPELRSASGADNTTSGAAGDESDSEDDADYAPSHSGSDDDGDMNADEHSEGESEDAEGDGASEPENSDIDPEEVDGLLKDADLTADQVAQSLNSRSLRRRGARAEDANDPSTTAEGAADVGKEVVVVRRGEMVVGTVTAFRYQADKGSSSSSGKAAKAAAAAAAAAAGKAQKLEDGVWTVQFEDDSAPVEVDLETIRKYLALFGEYRQLQRSEEASSASAQKSLLEEQGRLDAANVLAHKRAHRRTDYAALNKQMFGDDADRETDDGDAAYQENGAGEQQDEPRGGKNSDSSDSDGENWYERAGRLAASALSAAARQLTSSVTSSHFADTLAGVTVGSGYADIDFEEELRRSRGRQLGSKDRLSEDGLTASGKKRGRPLGCKDTKPRVRSGKPLGRPRKHPKPEPTMVYYNSDSEASDSERVMHIVQPEKRKRGRPRIHPVKEPSDVPRKRGRPRIHPLPDPSIPVVPRKRGRPPGSKTINRKTKEGAAVGGVTEGTSTEGGELDHALLQEVQDAESLSEAE